jgi:NTE family protein
VLCIWFVEFVSFFQSEIFNLKSSMLSIGLALSGGAARGIAHVGVLRALQEAGIPISCVAGTSAGSLVGAAFASGMTIDEIEALGRSLRWRHLGRLTLSLRGFQSNQRLEQFVRDRLPVTKFEELLIPFAAVATDLKTGEPVVMRDKGDLGFAIRASCTIPGVYVPVTDAEGRQLVDGGLVAVIPALAARALGADIVIAVDVNFEGATFWSSSHVIGVVLQSTMVFMKTASYRQLSACDYVIKPRVGHIRWDKIRKADDLIAAGYQAGVESVPEIKTLIEAACAASAISAAEGDA